MEPFTYIITEMIEFCGPGLDLLVKTYDFTIQLTRQTYEIFNQFIGSYRLGNALQGTGTMRKFSQIPKSIWRIHDTQIIDYWEVRREQKRCRISIAKDGLINILKVDIKKLEDSI